MYDAPQFRRDPVSGRWVIIAPERSGRPGGVHHAAAVSSTQDCPFCEGAEGRTPLESFAFRQDGAADEPGWQVRIFPNKFPALRPDVDGASQESPLFQSCAGWGVHEVVVESPRHVSSLTQLEPGHVGLVFKAYRDRLRQLSATAELRSALVFHNGGRGAGASQDHLHSQIVATSFVPPMIEVELAGAEAYLQKHGRDVFTDLLNAERAARTRVVRETERFVAFCPFAGRFAYEIWIVPRLREERYEETADETVIELGWLMQSLLLRLEKTLPAPAYNYFLHSAPFNAGPAPHYRWHWEVTPRTVGLAGWELGAGAFINAVSPEVAAAALRDL